MRDPAISIKTLAPKLKVGTGTKAIIGIKVKIGICKLGIKIRITKK